MAFITSLLSVPQPTGVWESIIKAFEAGVGSYILAIVLITLIIKIIWAPFETINKKINKKNMRIQATLQPELEKIKARYGADRNLLNQKTQELYKKHNYFMQRKANEFPRLETYQHDGRRKHKIIYGRAYVNGRCQKQRRRR